MDPRKLSSKISDIYQCVLLFGYQETTEINNFVHYENHVSTYRIIWRNMSHTDDIGNHTNYTTFAISNPYLG